MSKQEFESYREYTKTHTQPTLAEVSGGQYNSAEGVDPISKFSGVYPNDLKGVLAEQDYTAASHGAGDVSKMVFPAIQHLGGKVEFFDPGLDAGITEKHGAVRVTSPDDFSTDAVQHIIAPNRFHVPLSVECAENGKAFYCDKPIAENAADTEKQAEALANATAPSYFGDFHHYMGHGLCSLMGVNMPFKDVHQIESEKDGMLTHALETGDPLIPLDKITKVTASYTQGGDNPAAAKGDRDIPGMISDLVVHQTNLFNIMGLEIETVSDAVIGTNQGTQGEYKLISDQSEKGPLDLNEDYVWAKGAMKGDIEFELQAGKYSATDNQFIQVESDELVVRMEYQPPNRKTSVTVSDHEGNTLGKITDTVDPYLLMMLDAQQHCTGDNAYPMFFPEQQKSLQQMELIGEVARNPDVKTTAVTLPVFTISESNLEAQFGHQHQQSVDRPIIQGAGG